METMRTWHCPACSRIVHGDEVEWRDPGPLDADPPSPRCPDCGEPLKLTPVDFDALAEIVRRL